MMTDTKFILGGALLSITLAILTHTFLPNLYHTHQDIPKGSWACTTDVYICPDGTTLTRTPPYCHFPVCPQ